MSAHAHALKDDPKLADADDVRIPTIQLLLEPDGEWHRAGPLLDETACGVPLPGGWAEREYELNGRLCTKCHTKRERELAKHRDNLPANRLRPP